MSLEKLDKVKKWIVENKNADGLVDGSQLTEKIKEFGLNPQRIVKKLKEEGFIFAASEMGKWGVNVG